MNQNYAGFGIRLGAFVIDVIVLSVINGILEVILNTVLHSNISMTYGISLLVSIGYWVFYQESAGQTIGKKVMNIKVVDQSGAKPTLMTFFLREIIGKFISGIILGIGYLMIIWDGKKQGLHDKIASTYVVRV